MKKLSQLPAPKQTSLSLVTPPKVTSRTTAPHGLRSEAKLTCTFYVRLPTQQVTLAVVREAETEGIPYIWIQPGAEDAAVVEAIEKSEYLKARTVFGGPCVLKSGEEILASL